MSQNFKDIVQIAFEIVVILGSIGLVISLIKKVYGKIKNALFYFAKLEKRVQNLERKNKIKKQKTK